MIHLHEGSDILLSIITVTRNDAGRLSNTIKSLLGFYGDARFEHIVVDGGSIDGTSEVIAPHMNCTNFRFDSNQDNGIYDAMNIGVKRSRGKFILFLNCGDLLLVAPDEISIWLHEIEDKNFNIACFAFKNVHKGSKQLIRAEKITRYKMPTSHQGMIFLSSFVQTYWYDTRYKIAADYDLYLHSAVSKIILAPRIKPLTAVEVQGVASDNPVISYKEYLLIAFRNLYGVEFLTCSVRIACKAMFVIPMKFLFSRERVEKMKLKKG